MEFIRVADRSKLTKGNKMMVSLEGQEILLANINGSFYATQNKCPHMGASLYDGRLEGNNIICPRHGSVFDLTNGKAVESGTLLFVKVKVRDLKSFPVKVEGNDILVGI